MSRMKASSDPQLATERSSPQFSGVEFRDRIMMSLTEDDIQRKSTYGSIQEERRTSCCFAGDHFLTSNSQEFVRRSLSMDSVVHVDKTEPTVRQPYGSQGLLYPSQLARPRAPEVQRPLFQAGGRPDAEHPEFSSQACSVFILSSNERMKISDINGEGDISYVPLSLRKCKKTVIAPYSFILSFIGWRPWCQDSLSRRCRFWTYCNYVYPVIVALFIVCHYVFQVIGCQGKFNIHLDVEPSKPPPTPKEFNMEGNCTWGLVTFSCHAKYVMAAVEVAAHVQKAKYCQHIIPTYIVPSFVHFLAFAYGLYHFRLVKCEHLYSLMERVFLQTHSTHGLQNALVRNSRLFFMTAILWLLCQVGLEVLYTFTFSQTRLEVLGMTYKYVFLGIKFVGMILVHAVNVAVVINYCVQCETLILYIKGVCLRLHEKSMEIKSAMHEILGVREYISSLNGSVAKMMSLCIVNFTELTVLGTALLFFNKDPRKEVLSYRIIFPLLWFIALMVPLIQAARLTRIGSKLRQISFEMRVFGYQASSMLELDSFVLFVSGASLRSKLFGFTIRSSTVIMTFGLSVFVLVTLMVVDLITVSGYSEIF